MGPLNVQNGSHQIFLKNLRFEAKIGETTWGKPKAQLVVASIRLWRDFNNAGLHDTIDDTLSYSDICKKALKGAQTLTEDKPCSELEFHEYLHSNASQWNFGPGKLQIETNLQNILRAEGGSTLRTESNIGFSKILSKEMRLVQKHQKFINQLQIPCIIGVNSYERLQKQLVVINMEFDGKCTPQALAVKVIEVVEASSYETLEALSYRIGKAAEDLELLYLILSIEKPSAIEAVEGSGVQVTFHW